MRSAREQGVVTFDISYPIHRELDLEDELRSAFDEFGVRDVVVSQAFSETHAPRGQPSGTDEPRQIRSRVDPRQRRGPRHPGSVLGNDGQGHG